jgi:hypothetical protein
MKYSFARSLGTGADKAQLGLQAIARTICASAARSGDGNRSDQKEENAIIVTAQPPSSVLPGLRDAFKNQLLEGGKVSPEALQTDLRGCLERVSISRVFDLEGLWEVLGELNCPSSPCPNESKATTSQEEVRPQNAEQRTAKVDYEKKKFTKTEIADSEDEDDISPITTPPTVPESKPEPQPEPIPFPSPKPLRKLEHDSSTAPAIILIANFYTLLTGLFARREKLDAHKTLQLLSSHMRYLARHLPTAPLIMVLNTTVSHEKNQATTNPGTGGPSPRKQVTKPFDPTLRSVFNPRPLTLPGYEFKALSLRNKPGFGLIFTQLLDLHVLCSRLPRSRADAEALYAPGSQGAPVQTTSRGDGLRYVWIVECLIDELGVWEAGAGTGNGKARRSREQRWGAVDVDLETGTVIDAFEERRRAYGEVRVAGGFGGLRV